MAPGDGRAVTNAHARTHTRSTSAKHTQKYVRSRCFPHTQRLIHSTDTALRLPTSSQAPVMVPAAGDR